MRLIIVFQEDATPAQIDSYVSNLESYGVEEKQRIPLINGVIVEVPAGLDQKDAFDSPIVETIEPDRNIAAQGEGGAGEGGAGEGGAGEGGAGEGGAGEGGAGEGGAGEGGAEEGDAGEGGADQGDAGRFIVPVSAIPTRHYRSWAVVKLHGQPFDPETLMDAYDVNAVPGRISKARGHVRVAVFDTGVDWIHPRLARVIKGGIDLTNIPDNVPLDRLLRKRHEIPFDDNGHGTHISGLIAGRNVGLGQGFRLFAVKVLDKDATGSLSTIILALQWAITHRMDIVNMSLAFRDDSPAVRRAVRKAYDHGLIMVAAAGNHSNWEDDGISGEGGAGEGGAGEGGAGEGGAGEGGAGEGGAGEGGAGEGGAGEGGAGEGGAGEGGAGIECPTVRTVGNGAFMWATGEGGAGEGGAGEGGAGEGGAGEGGAWTWCVDVVQPYGVMFPAAYPEVLAVGASDEFGAMATFSNTGANLDILAPGTGIVSTDIGGGFGAANGTSMSAGLVTSALSMMLAYDHELNGAIKRKRGSRKVDLVRAIVRLTAKPTDSGFGDLNLRRALRAVQMVNRRSLDRRTLLWQVWSGSWEGF